MAIKTHAIVLENVSRLYPGGVRAVDEVSLRVRAGEWVALMGPSGSGKTTLLNLMDGLDRPTHGRLCILGRDTTRLGADEAATFRRENLGLIFQQFHLIPYLSALENVMPAQYYHSLVGREQARRALDAVQMTERAHHLPSQLSGGEQQRVCIARALINEPKIILADEPTANLDEVNEAKIRHRLPNHAWTSPNSAGSTAQCWASVWRRCLTIGRVKLPPRSCRRFWRRWARAQLGWA